MGPFDWGSIIHALHAVTFRVMYTMLTFNIWSFRLFFEFFCLHGPLQGVKSEFSPLYLQIHVTKGPMMDSMSVNIVTKKLEWAHLTGVSLLMLCLLSPVE